MKNNLIKNLNQYLSLKNVSYAALLLNGISVLFGILYVILIPITGNVLFWELYGAILLLTIFGNFILVYKTDQKLDKQTTLGNRVSVLSYVYLIFVIFGIIFVLLSNFIISVTYSNKILDNLGFYTVQFVFYFGIFVFGFFLGIVNIKNLESREVWKAGEEGIPQISERTLKVNKILKIILGILCLIALAVGLFLSASILFGRWGGGLLWMINMFFPELAFGISFAFLSITVILLKLISRKQRTKVHYVVALIGLIITGIMMMPYFMTPFNAHSAEAQFASAFGEDWRNGIDADLEAKYMMKSTFITPGYFLRIPPEECNYKADVLYFDGAKSNYSKDKDITLDFDVFWPKEIKEGMPGVKNGKSAIIIKIHGGSWRYGDKGVGHVMQVNKHFAAQGYIVYDIQYGLKDEEGGGVLSFITPENVLGDFDINDMVRHIGNFTKYISDSANQYSIEELDGNSNMTFISGGSAGGHLCCTTALGIYSGDYTSVFGDDLRIIGYIPFYPANGLSGLEGKDEFKNPEQYLIDGNAPPCLIYQGTNDPVCAGVSEKIKEEYNNAENEECAIIWLQFSGHANDIYYSGYYNQIFLYYYERFTYLCVEGAIA
ncbi:MAG: hypothetical protein ACOC44_17845 [Promethearchaeia archaeon]